MTQVDIRPAVATEPGRSPLERLFRMREVGAGLIAYTVIKAARGKFREIHWLVWVVSAVFLCYFGVNAIELLFR
jgi:hypothetical protein